MGGGSSGGSYRLGDTRALEEKAKQALQGTRNVFISFAYEDLNEVNLLRGQAKNENSDIEFNDYSVKEPYDSERAEYIKSKLKERIGQSSTTVVYISENTASSRWVAWEAEESIRLNKRVIAVYAGKKAPPMPSWVKEHSIQSVPWSGLADALKK